MHRAPTELISIEERISPFEKGGSREISGASWHFKILFFMRLNSYFIFISALDRLPLSLLKSAMGQVLKGEKEIEKRERYVRMKPQTGEKF